VSTIDERFEVLHPTSRKFHQRALRLFPDGVTHDIRHQTPFPLYVTHARGSRKWDADGNEIVDYVMGHGSLLLGHQHPAVVEAVTAQAARGTHYGASHELEIRWGELVQRLVPSAERLRFTSSGTEATMMALRLARAFTAREKVVRLREHFHGWNDSVTGQPPDEGSRPYSPGLPAGTLESSIVIPQNDTSALRRTFADHGNEIAAVIFEATGAHWGSDPIELDYVRELRTATREHGALLIFDEVITGFRVSPGGAQAAYGIQPDLTTMAKILGGGLPGGCVAGRADVFEQIAMGADGVRYGPERIQHPGTYNANPLSAAAGSACLALIADGEAQRRAAETAAALARSLNAVLREESLAGCVYGQSSMLHIALGMEQQPPDGHSWGWHALPAPPPSVSPGVARALRNGMLNHGVDLMAGGLMVSAAHGPDDVALTVDAFHAVLREMRAERLVR